MCRCALAIRSRFRHALATTGEAPSTVTLRTGLFSGRFRFRRRRRRRADASVRGAPSEGRRARMEIQRSARVLWACENSDQTRLGSPAARHVFEHRDLICQFLPVLIANGYHMVTVSHCLAHARRAPATAAGRTDPPARAIGDVDPARIPTLPATPSPTPAPNIPIADIPNESAGAPPDRTTGTGDRRSRRRSRHAAGRGAGDRHSMMRVT